MPGTLLVPAGLGGVAARLEVILEEMLEVRGLPTGRMPSMSCNERVRRRQWDAHSWRPWPGATDGGWEGQKEMVHPSSHPDAPMPRQDPIHSTPC